MHLEGGTGETQTTFHNMFCLTLIPHTQWNARCWVHRWAHRDSGQEFHLWRLDEPNTDFQIYSLSVCPHFAPKLNSFWFIVHSVFLQWKQQTVSLSRKLEGRLFLPSVTATLKLLRSLGICRLKPNLQHKHRDGLSIKHSETETKSDWLKFVRSLSLDVWSNICLCLTARERRIWFLNTVQIMWLSVSF